jgi:hypothetical protein
MIAATPPVSRIYSPIHFYTLLFDIVSALSVAAAMTII